MESIFRAAFMYIFLMFIIRIAGTRTLSEMTTFDFILLLVIGDASQQAITSNDYSVINAVIVIMTFILMDMLLAYVKHKFERVERFIDGSPVILINNGKKNKKLMDKACIEDADLLEAARKLKGLERLEQIKYAILEKNGEITIIEK